MQKRIKQSSIGHLSLSLFVFLVSIYSLTFSGTFISDDEHILASRTISLVHDGYLNDSRVYGNGRIYSYATSSPEYAGQGLNIEPGQAVVGSLFVRLAGLLGTGNIQTMFLLNVWVTAFTAIILFRAVLFWGYPRDTAFILALLFGVATVAWPYTRTYFRDVLAMMFLTITWTCAFFLTTKKRGEIETKTLYITAWILLILNLVAGILTKNTITLAVPVLIIYLISRVYARNLQLIKDNWKSLLILLVIVLLILTMWVKFLPSTGVFSRFTFSYYWSLVNKFFTTPHPHFWQALAGPLVSPGKSIILYSPILIFSVMGLLKRWELAWPSWLYLMLLIVSQALFYDGDWWGHINWGLRYLMPALPLLVIAAAPVINQLLRTQRGKIGLLFMSMLSVIVQLIGILPPTRGYYLELYGSKPSVSESAAVWNPKYSAMIWHLKYVFSGDPIDLAAIRVGGEAIFVVIGFLIVIGIILFYLKRAHWPLLPSIALSLSVVMSILMLKIYTNDPAYHRSRKDLEAAKSHLSRNVLPDDIVLLKSYSTPVWFYWMNWVDQNLQWISLPYYFPAPSLIDEYYSTQNPEIVLDEMTISILKDIPSSYRRVWLVLPDDSPGANLDIEINWIISQSASGEFWSFPGDDIQTRLFVGEFSPETDP